MSPALPTWEDLELDELVGQLLMEGTLPGAVADSEKSLSPNAEAARRRRRAAMLDALPLAVALIDHRGCVLECNALWRRDPGPGALFGPAFAEGGRYSDRPRRKTYADRTAIADCLRGLRRVLRRRQACFCDEYPAGEGAGRRWYRFRASPLTIYGERAAIVLQGEISRRKQQEELLRLRERALAEVSQGVLICDEKRRTLYANAGFTRMTGHEADEMLGRTCRILQGPGTDPATVQRIRETLTRGEPFEGEILNYRRDGSPFWNELSITPVRDEVGRVVRYIGIQRDVTERKRASEALLRSEGQYRLLFDSNPHPMWVFDAETLRFLAVNAAAVATYGYAPAEFLSLSVLDIAPAEERESRQRALRETATQSTWKGDWVHRRKDGSLLDVEVSAESILFGERPAFLVLAQDVTERNREARERRLATERLEIATRAGGLGIWDFDLTSGAVHWDAQMFALYGRPEGDAPAGFPEWLATLHPEDRAGAEACYQAAIANPGMPLEMEFRIVRAFDGEVRTLRAMAAIFRDERGRPARVVGTNADVTKERCREQDLALAFERQRDLTREAQAGERAKTEFLAAMSHEIRTPLNGIIGFAELLTQMPSLPAEGRSHVETIARSGEALLRIIDDILDFSRMEAGRLQIERHAFSPRKLVQDIEALFELRLREKNLAFEVRPAADLPEFVSGDEGRIRQVLVNLVGNALKFTEVGGVKLSIGVGARGWLVFAVEDTGPGIPADKGALIFEPFTQADSATSRRHGGMGLGLSISRRLAQLMGGSLELSAADGGGANFTLRVPVDEVAAPVPPRVTGEGPGVPLRVLIAEDDRVNTRLIAAMIKRLGYEPLIARDGREAVAVFLRERPDCVLMDLQMPHVDGFDATLRIREIERERGWAPAFVVAVTADILPEHRRRCFEVGMNDYLNKPIRSDAIAGALRRGAHFLGRTSAGRNE